NLISKDNTDNKAKANPMHKYEADSDNNNKATFNSKSEDNYYKAKKINYISD
ncbi:13713_t:CDS:1, partial [Cetraspora pellucida]